ncbi:YitT family protein [Ancylomarina longa]|uniref:YitT family protein n=1 Tax=Ancylomarina longa TaxID=2487017 RepID=A0A434AX31_9BACT|nr:YitT family protein [Ancylomarina longa]RUT79052.1 YitT family protein [Ancylomarina longa]
MAFIQKDVLFSGKWFYNHAKLIVGAFIMAAGFVFFIIPHNLVPGSVYGIGIIINKLTLGLFPHGLFGQLNPADYDGVLSSLAYHFMQYSNNLFRKFGGGIPVGISSLLINIPLSLVGIKILGPRFGLKTFLAFILSALFIDTITAWWGVIPLVDDVLLSCIFGGIFMGFGLGLILKARATSAGSDILAMIIAKSTKLPLGQMVIYIDTLIVLSSLYIKVDWQIPLYSFIVLFVTGKVTDITLQGSSYEKALFIISDKYEEIRIKVTEDMKRGGTFLKSTGMYDGREKNMIFMVVNRRELSMLQDYIHSIDPNAFVCVMETNEILGKGINSLREKLES